MPIAVDPTESWDYVLPEERDLPDDRRVSFKLKPLTLRDEKRIAQITKGQEDSVGMTEAGTYILKRGLTGWSNYKLADGTSFVCALGADGLITDGCIEHIDIRTRRSLIEAILYRNRLTEDDRKN